MNDLCMYECNFEKKKERVKVMSQKLEESTHDALFN